MTIELIFSIVTVVVTELFAILFKNNIVPAKFIPIQNLIIGLIAAVISLHFNIFEDPWLAILISLGMAFATGGCYDLIHNKNKIPEEQTTFNTDTIEELIEEGDIENESV